MDPIAAALCGAGAALLIGMVAHLIILRQRCWEAFEDGQRSERDTWTRRSGPMPPKDYAA